MESSANPGCCCLDKHRKTSPDLHRVAFVVFLVLMVSLHQYWAVGSVNFDWFLDDNESGGNDSGVVVFRKATGFAALHIADGRLSMPMTTNGSDQNNQNNHNVCPETCGCNHTPVDCPQWYHAADINKSVELTQSLLPISYRRTIQTLRHRHDRAKQKCQQQQKTLYYVLDSGGWCLSEPSKNDTVTPSITTINESSTVTYHDLDIPIPTLHVPASQRVVLELLNMIQSEDIRSITDFGAGVGQYKAAVLNGLSETTANTTGFVYHAYDGAGNVESYTHGFLRFVDLSVPLALPRSDWVLSLEVGEHIPWRYEAFFLRNLHYHNCRGVILSWASLGQGGYYHVNNHSNQYIIRVFEQLGYTHDIDASQRFRNSNLNYYWLQDTVMVFRRLHHVC